MEISVDDIRIPEDKHDQDAVNIIRNDLMSEEQIRRGNYYTQQYLLRQGEMQDYKTEWDELERLYNCVRELPDHTDENAPCSFIPIITPCVEGQTASMIESNIDFRHITNNPAHEVYMRQLDAASEYYRNKNMFRQHFKDFIRFYELFGNQIVKIEFDSDDNSKNGHKGLPRITVPPLGSVLFDGRIKDHKDIQRCSYIIQHHNFVSIGWARKEFGDDLANGVLLGTMQYDGDNPDQSIDDIKTFTLLEVWTRDNEYGNLQLIQMDQNGLILYESDPSEPYYKYVDNQYPFGFARMIPRIGKLYGIGDGAILKEIQNTVNNLTDEIELAARFSAQARTYADPASKLNPDDVTSNPADIILAKDPRNNILTVPGAGINHVVQNMIEYLEREAQKATRFHESMSGTQMNVSATATQINTQQAQGHVGIKDKKTDVSDVMAWADMYALKLCMEFWDAPFWASVAPGKSVFVDMSMLRSVPQVVPLTMDRIETTLSEAREAGVNPPELPTYVESIDDDGNPILSEIEFSTKVIIGESMPKGRTDMYNILLGLAQMQIVDKNGMPKPLVTADRLKEMFEDILGFKLQTEEEEQGMESEMAMDMNGLNAINPIGNNETVQTPTNLQQTVPQMPSGDSRSVQI